MLPNRLTSKTILITGGTSGLGFELAKNLYLTGANIFITGRNTVKGKEAVDAIASAVEGSNETGSVDFIHMDQSDLDSVKQGALDFLARSRQLNVLICNAGVMALQDLQRTKQGHEMQFGVNHLSHFLLIELLRPTLTASSSPQLASRIVVVSSCAHRGHALVEGGDYDFHETKYDGMMSYSQSKTANIYSANQFDRIYGSQGLHALSAHPGVILETGLVRHLTDDPKKLEETFEEQGPTFKTTLKTTEQGAATLIWAAVASDLEGKGGLYLEDCHVGEPAQEGAQWWDPGTERWCYDSEAEDRLWKDSTQMVKAWL